MVHDTQCPTGRLDTTRVSETSAEHAAHCPACADSYVSHIGQKQCRDCGEWKDHDQFPPHRGRCRVCHNIYRRAHVTADQKKQTIQRVRKWEKTHDKERRQYRKDAYWVRRRKEVSEKFLPAPEGSQGHGE